MHTARPRLMKPTLGDIVSRWGEAHQHPQYQGCVAHWAMVEGGGSALYDLSGYGNHGAMTNVDPATAWTMGRWGPTLTMDGVNDQVDSAPFTLAPYPLTLACWVRPSTVTGALGLLAYGSNSNEQLLLIVNGSYWAMTVASGADSKAITTGAVAGELVALVGVFASSSSRALYLNGVLVDTEPSVAVPTFVAPCLRLGNRFSASQPGAGTIESAQCFARALPAAEVWQSFTDPWAPWQARRRVWAVEEAGGGGFQAAWASRANQIPLSGGFGVAA